MGTFTRYRPVGFGFGMGMTPVVKALLIVNVAAFLLTGMFKIPLDRGLFLGLVPALAVRGMVWQLVTYMFLHGSLGHILFNMLALWMFGTALEQSWGQRRFLRYYLICGAGAGLTVVLAAYLLGGPQDRLTTTIGASGAIYGLLLAFGMMYPNAPVLVFLLFPMPAKYFVILMGAISFYMFGTDQGGAVSHVAHLGGLLAGFLYMKFSSRAFPYRGSTRRSALSTLLSWEDWRMAYERWRLRRLHKKFEVYMRKHDGGPDHWVQ